MHWSPFLSWGAFFTSFLGFLSLPSFLQTNRCWGILGLSFSPLFLCPLLLLFLWIWFLSILRILNTLHLQSAAKLTSFHVRLNSWVSDTVSIFFFSISIWLFKECLKLRIINLKLPNLSGYIWNPQTCLEKWFSSCGSQPLGAEWPCHRGPPRRSTHQTFTHSQQ